MTNPSRQLDEFWTIALSDETPPNNGRHEENDEDPFLDSPQVAQRLKTYSLPDGITLTVSCLPQREGIWSPLGAQAWHASSLLASYLIIAHRDDDLVHIVLETIKSGNKHVTVLELGSGAVGLSGMTLATVLENTNCHSASVLLTDLPHDGILENLQDNVNRNKVSSFPNIDVQVQPLDWRDYIRGCAETVPSLPPLDLVIGSELVYTEETARCCAAIVTRLLKDNPKLLIVIIQVMDRPGFELHFLQPLLNDFEIRIQQPIDAELHEVATRIVASAGDQVGGTLDRFAYGICWVRRKE